MHMNLSQQEWNQFLLSFIRTSIQQPGMVPTIVPTQSSRQPTTSVGRTEQPLRHLPVCSLCLQLLFVLDAVFASHASSQIQLFDQENDQRGGKDKNHGANKARR